MLNDLIYIFSRWRRRCSAIRFIEQTYSADSKDEFVSDIGKGFIVQVGGDAEIDWRDLPLQKLEAYEDKCGIAINDI